MTKKMKLLSQYDTLQEAHIVKGMLDANGIDSFVSENALSSVFPAPDAGTGITSLYVGDADYERAYRLVCDKGGK